MPEFRFRRKKKKQQSSRRHTVHDAEEAQATVAAAREMVTRGEVSEGGREGGREDRRMRKRRGGGTVRGKRGRTKKHNSEESYMYPCQRVCAYISVYVSTVSLHCVFQYFTHPTFIERFD